MNFVKSILIAFVVFSLGFSFLPAYSQLGKPAGRIVSLSGKVIVQSNGAENIAKPFQNLDEGDVIETGVNSRAAIVLRDESLVKLSSNSRVTIKSVLGITKQVSASSDKTELKQDNGEMWIRTKDRPGEMEIDTKSGSAAIRGTEFVIRASESETILTVLDGATELQNNFGSVLIAQNEQGVATPDSLPTKKSITVEEAENAVQWIFYFPQNLNLEKEVVDTDLAVLTENYNANKGDHDAIVLLGIKKLISGKSEDALTLFDEASKIDSSAISALMKARALFVLHRQKEALIEINKAVELDSNWYLPYADKSKYLLSQGDVTKAEKEAEKSVELGRDYPEGWISLGEVQYVLGRVNDASESFEKALNIDSNLAEAHIGKAKTLISTHLKEDAIDEFLAAVLLEPNFARAHLYLGQAYYQNRKTERAVQEIERAIELDPSDPLALNSLSIIYDVAHKYGDAFELDNKTIALTPNLLEAGARQSRNLSQASGNIGIQPLRFGLNDWAFFQANKALRENPIDGASHLTLGNIFNSNDVEPIIPKSGDAGVAQAQLSTGQVRGLSGTTLSGVNAKTSTNEFDLGYNFVADSERTVGRLLTPSVIGSPNGRYRFFRVPELYVTSEGFLGQEQISYIRDGKIGVNGYLGTPWNFYLNGEFRGGLVRNVFGDLTAKGNRSFAKADFAFSPHKTLDVIGSYTRADVNVRVFDKNFPRARSLFLPDLNIFDIALNWHPRPNSIVLSRFLSEITSSRLDGVTPELGGLDLFAGIFPRNYAYQLRHLWNTKLHKFTWGGEYVHSNNPSSLRTDFFSTGITPTVRTIGFSRGRSEYDIISGYFQDLLDLSDKVDAVIGFRYDQIFQRLRTNSITQTVTDGMSMSVTSLFREDTDRVSFSPQAGLAYDVGEHTTFRAAAQHKAFYNTFLPELAPQEVAGIPFSDQDEYFTRGTEGWEYAASLEQKLPWNAFFRIKPFYRRMIKRDFDAVVLQRQKIRNLGFKVSYNQLLYKQVGFFFTYIYQHIRDRSDDRIFDELTSTFVDANGMIPTLQVPNRYRFGLTWHSPRGFSVNWINTYIGPKFSDVANTGRGGTKIRGYFLGDVNLSYEPPNYNSFKLTFGVNNLYGAAFRQSLRQRDPGVTFFGNVELRGAVPIKKFW
ncbi:MAG: tetratricopeptide repeat protein [Candidatus Melainabacteria bacterium]|nr:tetratricopeptide repeat protein [Candidatus Melainabacteria bacterium]MBI3308730.1 tetratricopeptide repeat protein [Candidatus Melainabacteria bacterium]